MHGAQQFGDLDVPGMLREGIGTVRGKPRSLGREVRKTEPPVVSMAAPEGQRPCDLQGSPALRGAFLGVGSCCPGAPRTLTAGPRP